jgi:ribonuclease HI
VYTPWYEGNFLPWDVRRQDNLHDVPVARPKIRSLGPVAASIDKSLATSPGAFGEKAVLRTPDLALARQRLANAMQATVWCDGGCEPNPGLMGWGVVIQSAGEQIELYGGGRRGTNNAAELSAALLALECLPARCNTTIFSDSQYLIFGMTRWMAGWRRKNFIRAGKPIPNAGLWRRLHELASSRPIQWQWIRGHSANWGNQIADQLAALGRSGQPDGVAELMIGRELHQHQQNNPDRGMDIPK